MSRCFGVRATGCRTEDKRLEYPGVMRALREMAGSANAHFVCTGPWAWLTGVGVDIHQELQRTLPITMVMNDGNAGPLIMLWVVTLSNLRQPHHNKFLTMLAMLLYNHGTSRYCPCAHLIHPSCLLSSFLVHG